MKIYTRLGDDGTTSLVDSRVNKSDTRIEAVGALDHLNAQIGFLIDYSNQYYSIDLIFIQNILFTFGAQIAGVDNINPISYFDVANLEESIDEMTKKLPKLTNFILPSGHPLISQVHIVRTICRATERTCSMIEDCHRPINLIPYLNRLSDYLFTIARLLHQELDVPEIIWNPAHTHQ